MPKNPLLSYIRDHIKQSERQKEPGPVITISREFGCYGFTIAEMVSSLINEKHHPKPLWQALNKQVIQEAAKELDLPSSVVEAMERQDRKGLFSDMLFSSAYFPNDAEIKKTVVQIVKTLGQNGHVILVGRGGAIINQDIAKSIHIWLYASKRWRLKKVEERFEISHVKALELVENVDRERKYILNLFAGEEVRSTAFTACYNCEFMTNDEIAQSIYEMALRRGLLA